MKCKDGFMKVSGLPALDRHAELCTVVMIFQCMLCRTFIERKGMTFYCLTCSLLLFGQFTACVVVCS
jgi:hypothetical protein